MIKDKKRVLEKALFNFCEPCQTYTRVQASKKILQMMEQQGLQTWVVARYCKRCRAAAAIKDRK